MAGQLSNSPAEVIRELLLNLSLGVFPDQRTPADWSIYDNGEPDLPNHCITVYDTQGRDHGKTFDGERQEHYGCQIKIRADEKPTANTRARNIATTLDAVTRYPVDIPVRDNITPSGMYTVYAVSRSANVIYNGKDKPNGRRHVYTLNILASIRQRSSGVAIPLETYFGINNFLFPVRVLS